MKKTGLILSFILITTFLFSCTKTEETQLSFRITWDDFSGRGEAIQKIVDSYNENQNDNSIIEMISGDEDLDTIESLLKSDTDTIYVLPYRSVKYFGDKGYLADLTEEFNEDKELFYSGIWELGTNDGITYGVPWLGHSMCLIYNKNLLEQAGVDPESINSLDSLMGAINLIEANTDAQGIGLVGASSNDISWMVNQFIYGFNSSLVREDGTQVTINNENSVAAIEFYKNQLGAHAQPTWLNDTGVEVMDYFREQQVAFEIQGIWGVTDIIKNGSTFETGIITMEEIGMNAEVGPMMLAIPKDMGEAQKEEAIKFMRYLISMDAQTQIMNGEYSPEYDAYFPFRTPIRKDMENSVFFENNPEYLKFIEGFKNPSVDVPVPEWETVKADYYEAGLHQVMNNEITIQEFLQKIEIEGNKILGGGET